MNLDCETLELAEQSLAAILGIDRARLCKQVCEFQITDFEVHTSLMDDRWQPMLNAVAGHEIADTDCGKTCWFHATRVKNLASFRSGIRPLPQQLNEIWDSLYPLVADCISPTDWSNFRRKAERDNFGGHSKEVINAWMSNEGPYAFLFAESALNPKGTGNHDYLATSELLEFISICFKREYGVNLHARHHAATQPALIKFLTRGIRAIHLGAALDYVLHRANGWSLSCLDPCFSADGQQISPDQMVKAIPVLEGTGRLRNYATYSLSPTNTHVSLRF